MPVAQALREMLATIEISRDTVTVPVTEALGRVLVREQLSPIDVPPADNSAMDGYALCSSDATAVGQKLQVSQYLPAGTVPRPLSSGTAARIFTGGMIPAGADVVIPQECVKAIGDEIMIDQLPHTPGQHIRRGGEDIRKGQQVLAAGRRLTAADLGLLASIGLAQLTVRRPLRVALLGTGDELLEPGMAAVPGRIYNSNRYTLSGFLNNLRLQIVDGGIAPDGVGPLKRQLLDLAANSDCIITTGGVSVGDRDYLREVLKDTGALRIWRLAIKPGKPLAFATIGKIPVFALPGNPAAVFVTFCVLVRPCLLKLQGAIDRAAAELYATADFARPAIPREEYIRARLQGDVATTLVVSPVAAQGSGILSAASQADCLAVVPANREVKAGNRLRIIMLDALVN